MGRLEQIKDKYKRFVKNKSSYFGWLQDIEYLLRIAECAERMRDVRKTISIDNIASYEKALYNALEGDDHG